MLVQGSGRLGVGHGSVSDHATAHNSVRAVDRVHHDHVPSTAIVSGGGGELSASEDDGRESARAIVLLLVGAGRDELQKVFIGIHRKRSGVCVPLDYRQRQFLEYSSSTITGRAGPISRFSSRTSAVRLTRGSREDEVEGAAKASSPTLNPQPVAGRFPPIAPVAFC